MAETFPSEAELAQQLAQLSAQAAVDYLNQLAETAAQKEPARVVDYALRAYERALVIGYSAGLAEACRLLGIGALFAGRYGEAQQWFAQAQELFFQLGHREKALSALVNGALAYHAIGEHAHALEWLQQALEGGVREFPALFLKALQNLGIVLAELGRHEQALQIFEEVIAEARRQGALQTLARAYNNAALLLATRGEFSRALEYQQASTCLKEQHDDAYGLAISYATLGYLYARMGSYTEAERAYEQSLELRRRVGDRRGIAYVLTNLGELSFQQGNFGRAHQVLNDALRIAEELRETALQLEIYRWLSRLCQAEGDATGALHFLQQTLALLEQLLDERTQQALTRVQTRYELERSRREQEELRRQLVEWQYRALQAQLNPHFLFNVLVALQSLLLQHELEVVQRFVQLFAAFARRVLENSSHGLVPLQTELDLVELYLQLEQLRWKQAFSYTLEVVPGIEPEDVWCPSLLLQPLVENAVKHGLAPRGGRGRIAIRIEACPECLLCTIEDDGVGRKTAQAVGSSGMGLRLTEERLRLLSQHLGGSFSVRIVDRCAPDGSPEGTRVEITLPLQIDVRRAVELGLLKPVLGLAKPVFSP